MCVYCENWKLLSTRIKHERMNDWTIHVALLLALVLCVYKSERLAIPFHHRTAIYSFMPITHTHTHMPIHAHSVLSFSSVHWYIYYKIAVCTRIYYEWASVWCSLYIYIFFIVALCFCFGIMACFVVVAAAAAAHIQFFFFFCICSIYFVRSTGSFVFLRMHFSRRMIVCINKITQFKSRSYQNCIRFVRFNLFIFLDSNQCNCSNSSRRSSNIFVITIT